jgi:hypothetical protein
MLASLLKEIISLRYVFCCALVPVTFGMPAHVFLTKHHGGINAENFATSRTEMSGFFLSSSMLSGPEMSQHQCDIWCGGIWLAGTELTRLLNACSCQSNIEAILGHS